MNVELIEQYQIDSLLHLILFYITNLKILYIGQDLLMIFHKLREYVI